MQNAFSQWKAEGRPEQPLGEAGEGPGLHVVCPCKAERSRGHGHTHPMSELGIQEAIPTPPDPDEALRTQFSLPCSANKEPGPGEEAAAHPGPRTDAWRCRAAMKAWHPPTQPGASYGPGALPATLSPARNLRMFDSTQQSLFRGGDWSTE